MAPCPREYKKKRNEKGTTDFPGGKQKSVDLLSGISAYLTRNRILPRRQEGEDADRVRNAATESREARSAAILVIAGRLSSTCGECRSSSKRRILWNRRRMK